MLCAQGIKLPLNSLISFGPAYFLPFITDASNRIFQPIFIKMQRPQHGRFGAHTPAAKGILWIGFDGDLFFTPRLRVIGDPNAAHSFAKITNSVMCLKAHFILFCLYSDYVSPPIIYLVTVEFTLDGFLYQIK